MYLRWFAISTAQKKMGVGGGSLYKERKKKKSVSLQHFIGKLPPDLMGLLRRGFARFKGLYQVVGQIVALLIRLI